MKVKIGNKIYSANDEPIMIILSDNDKENISNMIPMNHKYCVFPETFPKNKISEFMNIKRK